MVIGHDRIDAVIALFSNERDRYERLALEVARRCRDLLRQNVIRGTVQFRAKNPEQLRRKLLQRGLEPARCSPDMGPAETLACVGDLAGVRINTYVEKQREEVVGLVQRRFSAPPGAKEVVVEVKDRDGGVKFYRATHCQISLSPSDLAPDQADLAGIGCEIQVCSMLAHVWNEIEHDLAYKPLSGAPSEDEADILRAIGQMLVAGDVLINLLLEANHRRIAQVSGVFTDDFDFVVRTRPLFPQAGAFHLHAPALLPELRRLGYDSLDRIQAGLLEDEPPERIDTGLARLGEYLREAGETRFSPDPQSSDRLLLPLLERHADELVDPDNVRAHLPGEGRIPALAEAWLRACDQRSGGASSTT